MQWHKWYLTSISKLLMISACNCKGYPQTHMYIRQQLVPPSLSTASLPYLTHSLWRASGWPENVRACVCVWPQWRPIRVGYGKHRLKSWIMEKLIWSMDQQVTVSMQHTHKNTDTHTHLTHLPNWDLVETVLLLVIITSQGHPPFNDKD